MLGLEVADGAARLWAEDAVGRNAERSLERLDGAAPAAHPEERAAPVAASLPCKSCSCLRADEPVDQKSVSLLKRPHGRTRLRAEDPVGVDADGTLNLGNFWAAASEAQQLDVGARDSGGSSSAVGSTLNGKRGGHGGHEE